MDSYRKLTVNTVILLIGTMGSKIITFFMLPFYTNILSPSEYGTIDLLLQICNFLVPVCTAGITTGIIRFGLDSQYNKADVFTTALFCFAAGCAICLWLDIAVVILPVQEEITRYGIWILLLIMSSSLHAICGSFVRAQERVRTFAITGIINTLSNILLMVLFLKFLQMGITGYLLAVTLADALSVLFLMFSSKLWSFIDFKLLHLPTTKEMLRFSIPTIPATISWWIMEMADRFMIAAFISAAANGIYSVAARIPSIVSVISGVFINAWQISIISTKDKEEQSKFYSNIMRAYESILFFMAGFVTIFSRIIISLLTTPDYYEAWEYVPMLISATLFSCLATFVGNIYTVVKKSIPQLVTTLFSALVNILLNWILIPRYGVHGAVFATLFSFVLLFAIRLVDTRKHIDVNWSPLRFCTGTALLMLQNLTMLNGQEPVYIIQTLCLAALAALYYKPLLAGIKKVMKRA